MKSKGFSRNGIAQIYIEYLVVGMVKVDKQFGAILFEVTQLPVLVDHLFLT